MPYCRKCGAELKEDARFCHACGTPVGTGVVRRIERRRERMPVFVSTMILVAILVSAFAIVAVFMFLPVNPVNLTKSESVPYEAGIDALDLNFSANIARVNVAFEGLAGKLVVLNVSATGGTGIFVSSNPVNVTFNYTFVDNVLVVGSSVDIGRGWPWSSWLNVVCDLRVDSSLRTSMKVRLNVGSVVLDAKPGVILDYLSVEAVTGGVEANLKGVTVNGNLSVRAVTGGVNLSLDNIDAAKNIVVDAGTTTGGVTVNVVQNETLPANVTLNAQTTTGGVSLDMAIRDGVAAYIESNTAIGSINVNKVEFSGTKSPLQSSNYPANSNFIVTLRTTTGGISIDAEYVHEGTVSS